MLALQRQTFFLMVKLLWKLNYFFCHAKRHGLCTQQDLIAISGLYLCIDYQKVLLTIIELRHDKTNKVSVRPAKTQISLGIRPVWSESLLCTQWVAKDPSFLHVDSEGSDQTGRMPRLIWVFAGCTVTLLVLSCRGSIILPQKIVWYLFAWQKKITELLQLFHHQ